ncbi:hypothetical protein TRIP_D300131 [uncultured Paludibacter sp.]|nr:hypothetical protein TRIP_D300131 [uncultured Paludibacter sp.]
MIRKMHAVKLKTENVILYANGLPVSNKKSKKGKKDYGSKKNENGL